jgi:AsmA protein
MPKIAADFTCRGPTIPQKVDEGAAVGLGACRSRQGGVAADLTTKFDQSNIKAKLGMEKFSAAAYSFDVVIDQLNVDKYMPPKEKACCGGSQSRRARRRSRKSRSICQR